MQMDTMNFMERGCAMSAKLNPVYANLAVALIISVLAFRLGGLAGHIEYQLPSAAQQYECSR
jgi:hypothetical protein